jgi:hypothetical protein
MKQSCGALLILNMTCLCMCARPVTATIWRPHLVCVCMRVCARVCARVCVFCQHSSVCVLETRQIILYHHVAYCLQKVFGCV